MPGIRTAPGRKKSISPVFSIKNDKEFLKQALALFKEQYETNKVYGDWVRGMKQDPSKVKTLEEIPFLPIRFFKSHDVICGNSSPLDTLFLSSGTTGMERSKHRVKEVSIYETSFRTCFRQFYGDPEQYAILALLPSYYENRNSSLLYMVQDLLKLTRNPRSGFYNGKDENLYRDINALMKQKQKTILIGVSFALLDMSAPAPFSQADEWLTIIETGGMKGRKEEITREELHRILTAKFGVSKVHSEYGMTELLSQAWSTGRGIFQSPAWMKVLIRDVNDPLQMMEAGRSGAINIIDLANRHSCAFIATDDVGRTHPDGSFEILGRLDHSDLRGCNLLAV